MPLASAIGKFAKIPMRMQQMPDASAVHATSDSFTSGVMPVAPARICGLTNRMYAIVRNVAPAPRSSRAGVVPRRRSSKYSKIHAMGDMLSEDDVRDAPDLH